MNVIVPIEETLDKYNRRENFEKDYSMFAKLRKLVGDVISKAKKKIDAADFVKCQKINIYNYLKSRMHFEYNTKDVFEYMICCHCFRTK